MPLHPQAKTVLDALPSLDVDLSQIPPSVLRETFSELGPPPVPEAVEKAEDRTIPGPGGNLPIRIYTPAGLPEGPQPTLVYFHGGGWVIGDLESHDPLCRELANLSRCLVVAVDYRLAPEAPFPAAPDDCFAATRWVAEKAGELGADATRIAVGGDSAGGNLAAAVSMMARDQQGPALCHQLLVYPVTECSYETASYEENKEGYLLTRDLMKWFWGHYLARESDAKDPLAAPLLARDLRGLPGATVITAEYDPLRDEGEAYAERLREAGVATDARRYDGMFHGFFTMSSALDDGRKAVEQAAANLRRAFGC